ncbi:unnamed protein product [Dracunculus medinensis]|uniref:Homeobox domain-containing protein n=1 Tax=Dracunculus medinensis TaxID=318479 RepID=A0A158Q3D9_DRAME|nr:unnamed protein product [Dracunculus medinensis]
MSYFMISRDSNLIFVIIYFDGFRDESRSLANLVSTWFANARRRLKKENKMTWAPPNRPGDDDDDVDDDNDDDFADIDAVEADQCERPSSSGSENVTDNYEVKKEKLETSSSPQDSSQTAQQKCQIKSSMHETFHSTSPQKTSASNKDANNDVLSKKNKIWSIAETISNDSSSSNKKDQPTSSSSNPKLDENSASHQSNSIQLMGGSFNFPANSPFLNLNQWHQQMSLAMHRLPSNYHRPDLFSMMAQTAPLRPVPPPPPPSHLLYNPILIKSVLPPQQPLQTTATSMSNGKWYDPASSPVLNTNDGNNLKKGADSKKD